jgi:hypothetical protein
MSHMLPLDELVSIVSSDLRYIRNEWGEDVSDDALRRGSATLRMLLVQGELQSAWKLAGFPKEPIIPTAVLPEVDPALFELATAGMAVHGGITLEGLLVPRSGRRVRPEVLAALNAARLSGGLVKDLKLSEFTRGICLIAYGLPISRHLVIKYVANKLGGAHFDGKRSDTDGALFRQLDRIRAEYLVLDKPPMYFELLAMGQALSASRDLAKLAEVT